MRKLEFVSVLALMAASQACVLYQEPAGAPLLDVKQPAVTLVENTEAVRTEWWTHFDDVVLDALVTEALANNNDVRVALANVNSARAVQDLERWGYLPSGGASVEIVRSRTGDANVDKTAQAGMQARWELDLFGRVLNSNRIATADRLGTEAALDGARLLVVTEAASTYFLYRAAEQKQAARSGAVSQQREVVSLTEALVEEFRVSPDQLDRAKAELAADEIALLHVREEQEALENRLAVLLGKQPGQWQVPSNAVSAQLRFHPRELVDLTAALQKRPDVRIAEQAVIARQAATGIERAGYFPSIGVSGFIGFTAGSFGELDGADTATWSVAPALHWNLLDFGRTARRVSASEARAEAAIARYEQTVLAAIEETENALEHYRVAQRELALREQARRYALSAAAAADARYQEGLGAYLDALLARRDAIAADLARADALADQRLATIALFKVVGATP